MHQECTHLDQRIDNTELCMDAAYQRSVALWWAHDRNGRSRGPNGPTKSRHFLHLPISNDPFSLWQPLWSMPKLFNSWNIAKELIGTVTPIAAWCLYEFTPPEPLSFMAPRFDVSTLPKGEHIWSILSRKTCLKGIKDIQSLTFRSCPRTEAHQFIQPN